MRNLLNKIFSIYPGEGKSALLFSLLGFLWAFTLTAAIKYGDALFLIHVGADSLPTASIITSVVTITFAFFFLCILQAVEAHKIFISALMAALLFYSFVASCLCFGVEAKWLFLTLRVGGYVLLTVMITSYWTFVDHYYHIQDAKRIYSLLTSSLFSGIALTGLLMHLGLFSFQTMLFVIIGLLAVAQGLILLITKILNPVHNEHEHEAGTVKEDHSLFALLRSLISSPFTLFLAGGSFLTYLLMNMTEFNYMSAYEEHFAQFTNNGVNFELTQFMGKCVAGVSIVSLLIGLFIYSRVIHRFGVTSLLLFTPALLLLAFMGMTFTPFLVFPILGNFLDEGAIYVIEDSNLNLMLNGAPSKIKYKIRLFIESFFEPFGALVSGLLLSLPFVESKYLGIGFSLILFCVAIALRRRYIKAIYSNLSENAIHFDRPLTTWFKTAAEKHRLLALLRLQGDFALKGLMHLKDPEILPTLLKQLDHQTKLTFLNNLKSTPFSEDPQVLDAIGQWSLSDDLALKGASLFYLAEKGRLSHELAHTLLAHEDLTIRGAALVALKKSSTRLPPEMAIHNRTVALQKIHQMITSKKKPEICMALTLLGVDPSSSDTKLLYEYLKHPFVAIARAAAASLVHCRDKDEKALIQALTSSNDHRLRMLCLETLNGIQECEFVEQIIDASAHFRPKERRYTEQLIFEKGKKAVPHLISSMKNETKENRCRVLAGRVLGRLSLSELRNHLHEIISVETERALFYFYHHHTVQEQNPNHKLSMLTESLLSSYHTTLDFIIQLLGAAYELEDGELLSRLLRSPHPKLRSQVVEALEKTCDISLFRIIDPLISERPLKEKLRHCEKRESLNELLDTLSESPLQLDQVIAATYMHRLQVPKWKEALERQLSKKEAIFHNFARELLEK